MSDNGNPDQRSHPLVVFLAVLAVCQEMYQEMDQFVDSFCRCYLYQLVLLTPPRLWHGLVEHADRIAGFIDPHRGQEDPVEMEIDDLGDPMDLD